MVYTVACDGSGDFTSIQAAVDAMPVTADMPNIVFVRAGEYHERVIVDRCSLRIVGEDCEHTVITHAACAKDQNPDGSPRGTFLSFTVIVTGDNVELENLTVRNDAGDGRLVGQAVALYAAGDRNSFRNCRFIAHQDTLFTGPLMEKVVRDIGGRSGRAQIVPSVGDCPPTFARQYYENCFIQGDVDFIFGPYRCWFEGCSLYMNARGGWYTAANTPETQPYGFIFHRCRLTGECEEGKAYLGRPWRKFSRTVFLECDMDEHVSPQGFADWEGGAPVTWRYGEAGTIGARRDQTPRHPSQKRLSKDEAAEITVLKVIGGYDKWQPDRGPMPISQGSLPREKAALLGGGFEQVPVIADSARLVADCLMKREGLLDQRWSYDYSVVWRGMEMLYALGREQKYFDYIYDALDTMINEDGSMLEYDAEKYNLDYLCIGKQVLYLWKKTGEERFLKALKILRSQLDGQMRTSDGGFWHKKIYPYQMWLDGQHMAIPFYIEYEMTFGKNDDALTDAANQLLLAYRHTLDPRTGLPCHGWDESRSERWADRETGRSRHAWGRAVGWYMTALVDSLEMLPKENRLYGEVRKIYTQLSEKLLSISEDGVWLQVLDCPGRLGNYKESSASCLIVYALLKGCRLGLLPRNCLNAAKESFVFLQRHFLGRLQSGEYFIAKCCKGAGLGGAAKRDGSFSYYISEPVTSFDLKATGAFLQAACEYELAGVET